MKPTDTIGDDIRLYRGDCLAVLPTLAPGSVDAVVTDPPFKLSQEYGTGADADNLLAVSAIWPAAVEMFRVTRAGGLCGLFYDTRILPLALAAMQAAGWKYLRALTLYRRWGQASLVHGWMTTSDFVLVFAAPGQKPQFHGEAAHDVYTKSSPEGFNAGHPAQKPLNVVRHLVENLCPSDGTVLDCFFGSGTTAQACQQSGRKFIGIELDPGHYATALRRLTHAAGKAADQLFSVIEGQP